ncbi:MAG TPA: MFS transporter [Usitatibacter sp.]|jgi:MFS family permease|nr:MFS transporter [Usitatibacter sp.]
MTAAQREPTLWSPFRHRAFAVVWTATVVSNIGAWMYNAASAWLMTNLSPDPLMVSLVQVASSLPIFLFALPAGALADIVDRRRFLLVAEISITAVSLAFAALVAIDAITPWSLLVFAVLIGIGGAVTAPPYQSIVPLLVPREDLAPAVAANSVGINISRAVGPALGGVVTAAAGIAAPFWINGASNLASVAALWWWKPPKEPERRLPAERVWSAMRSGIRYARHNPALRSTLVRAVAFFLFASSYWALLPLVARNQVAGGADLYGVLLGAIGAGAIAGAFALPAARKRLGPDGLVACGSVGTALAIILYGVARDAGVALAASVIAGVSWIATLSTLNVSAQVALPGWVRSRGLAIYVTVFFGALTLGSVLWGQAARIAGLPLAHFLAAAGALIAIPLTWRWKLQKGIGVDLTPSSHWPAPVVSTEIDDDSGPVMVNVEYRVAAPHRNAFLEAIEHQAAERQRDGAYWWGVFEDVARPGTFVESFHLESWTEHLRQHDRVTRADREVEKRVRRYAMEDPQVRHFIAPGKPAEETMPQPKHPQPPPIESTRLPDHSNPQDPEHLDWLIDEGSDESFPASDPSEATMPHPRPEKPKP